MLTFTFHEDKFKDDIIKESKPLRDKFNFVMIKIAKKWLRAMRMQRETWNIDKFKEYQPYFFKGHKKTKKIYYANDTKDEISYLSKKLAGIAIWNETIALKLEKDILELFSDAYFELKYNKMDLFLQKIKDHLETTTTDYFDKAMTCQNAIEGDCLPYLKKYYSLMQLPFEINKEYKHNGYGWMLGFGTYLAYFTQKLTNRIVKVGYPNGTIIDQEKENYGFLTRNEKLTDDEKVTREYMNLVLTNLAQGQEIGNISIWELANILHNSENGLLTRVLQNELGCTSSSINPNCSRNVLIEKNNMTF